MTGEFNRTTRTSSVEVTFRQGMCGATVRNGKFINAYIADRHSGFAMSGSLCDLENLIRDIQAVVDDVLGELSK